MRHLPAALAATALATAFAVATPAHAAPGPIDLVGPLSGFERFWTPGTAPTLNGTVVDPVTLSRNDQIVTWINDNATSAQRFAALQDSLYGTSPASYDQSITIGTGLGSVLGPLYIAARQDGSLPLTSALINSETGTGGAVASSGVDAAKSAYRYPRPFLPSNALTGPPKGCADPASYSGASLLGIRTGQPWADSDGDLLIGRVAAQTDTTFEFTPTGTPSLDPGYAGLCEVGGFPSGHTTTAYQAGLLLATMLPELAPEILSRGSENGNNRMVLGVHSPLDIMGGRIGGHVAIAAVWSDAAFRTATLLPAIAELRTVLEARCGGTIAACAAQGAPYSADPYGGAVMPGGTAQIVTDRASAIAVYRERLTYGFTATGAQGLAPEVPAGAGDLLLTTFPTLTDAQRAAVLAQTELPSGYPLDLTGTGGGAWQRLDLAAAMSATVQLNADGSVTVVSTGGAATVLAAPVSPVPVLPVTGADAASGLAPFAGAGALLVAAGLLLTLRRRRPAVRVGAERDGARR